MAKFIPEFEVNGKDRITIRQVLTHTGGFHWPNIPLDATYDAIIAAICAMHPEPSWTPGEKAGYHARTGWFILGEILPANRRPTVRSLRAQGSVSTEWHARYVAEYSA